ncbi:hypothetical protein UFOVP1064_27 [uncultured Caudovirales phage]|uniref:Uncharacterized protein n=1 Tax=uncultured Caudovirales phage TaxID=2100421 RepID=A0A6J5NBT9_9CAUD|nr:hypothetical protein UFOVP659_48 [uncultured Caudovirales phage]CAB4169382.1 hypothetical protein UFOVP885_27 [uncultured Caudovirales phage]CAB4181342.1 hypothetical protein UFOVP1064_27 [uncultured Caudovirales phage]CAB4190119.1 hypothetical protein UFOVP1197_36 [uncultured Caudovirales phage]CAB4196023.1 hypothetical protein UFOVP1294_54 [uncultured Caudovirales phage]
MNHDITKEGGGSFGLTLNAIDVGDTIVYYVGAYAKGPHKADALKAYEAGLCFLYQRKLPDGQFAYTAAKKKTLDAKNTR